MSPENPEESFAQWLDENWKPNASDAHEFGTGLVQRRKVHQRRRVGAIATTLIALVMVGGIWSQIEFPTSETVAPIEIAQVAETEDGEDFWATAFDETTETQTIPEDYQALAGFFFEES